MEKAFATGREDSPALTCNFQLDLVNSALCFVPTLCRRLLLAGSSPDSWFTSHFALLSETSLAAWDGKVNTARTCSPLWPASRHSQNEAMKRTCDVFFFMSLGLCHLMSAISIGPSAKEEKTLTHPRIFGLGRLERGHCVHTKQLDDQS